MYLQNSFDDFEGYNLFNNSVNNILLQKIFVKQHLGFLFSFGKNVMAQTKVNINLFSVLNHVINISMCVKTNKIIMTTFLPSNGYKTKGNTDPFFCNNCFCDSFSFETSKGSNNLSIYVF